MTTTHSRLLIDCFVAGAADLKQRSALVDAINVFPVMDGDTGQNMTATLEIFSSCKDSLRRSALSALPSLLNGPLLREAKGNSGIILAQFIVGFIDALSQWPKINRDAFAAAVRTGSEQAVGAVASPRQGTMLTLMDELARICGELPAKLTLDVHRQLENRMAESVRRTTGQLSSLKQAGVVDSGALGFHIFASGLTLVLPAITAPDAVAAVIAARIRGEEHCFIGNIESAISPAFRDAARQKATKYRYCVNLLVELRDGHPTHADFSTMGDSVNTITLGDLLKLHIHTNHPEAIVSVTERWGRIADSKIQDMVEALIREASPPSSSDNGWQRFRIVGDSSMSLSPSLGSRWGIARIDNYVSSQGRAIRDSQINSDELYSQMRTGQTFTTAHISREVVTEFFTTELQRSEHLLFIAVGQAYTGTQQIVLSARERHPEKHRITVLDSVAASGQQGVVALATAQFAREATSLEAVLDFAANQISLCREYLVIDDLSYLRRSGRIGRIRATLASVLTIKPIVGHGHNGAVTHTKTRSHEAAVDEIFSRVAAHPGEGRLLTMVEYTDNRPWAEHVAKTFRDKLPDGTDVVLSPLSSSSGVHMGPGTWGVAVTRC